jgi:hypothetical protein
MSTDDRGVIHCPQCGHYWQSRDVWLWWPISVRIRRRHDKARFFAIWGAEVGGDGPGIRYFCRFVRAGWLLLRFGPHTSRCDYYPRLRPVNWHGSWGWFNLRDAAKLQQHLDDEAQIEKVLRRAIEGDAPKEEA